jgi:coatomer subunit beta'
VEDAFELLHEINERVRTGLWVGDCFIYNNSSWRLNYCVGGEVCISRLPHKKVLSLSVISHLLLELILHELQVTTLFHLDRPMYLLGYLANQSRVYLIDKQFK